MKRIKRTLAALLTVVLTLALLGEAVFADNSEQPVWPEEGAIQLSKSAAAVEGKENTWEVTLGIQGKNYKTTSDVVLVIDNSNSMYDNSRMAKTKAAANAFVDTLLTEERDLWYKGSRIDLYIKPFVLRYWKLLETIA